MSGETSGAEPRPFPATRRRQRPCSHERRGERHLAHRARRARSGICKACTHKSARKALCRPRDSGSRGAMAARHARRRRSAPRSAPDGQCASATSRVAVPPTRRRPPCGPLTHRRRTPQQAAARCYAPCPVHGIMMPKSSSARRRASWLSSMLPGARRRERILPEARGTAAPFPQARALVQ